MAQDKIEILIEAKVKEAIDSLDAIKNKSKSLDDKGLFNSLKQNWLGLTAAVTAVYFGIKKVVDVVGEFVNAAVAKQQALTKLKLYSDSLGLSFDEVKKSVIELTKDGLVPFTEMSQAMSNLLAKGFNLKQANDLLSIFKDNAILARPAHLSLSEAIVKTTEGIKNENSMLTDSSGIQKNYARILEEGAKAIGKTTTALTNSEKTQILYNGFMKEGAVLAGSAAKESEKYAGTQAKLNSNMTILKETIGNQLLPGMGELQKGTIETVKGLTEWIKKTNAVGIGMAILEGIINHLVIAGKVAFNALKLGLEPIIDIIKGVVSAITVLMSEGTLKQKFELLKTVTIGTFTAIKTDTVENVTDIKNGYVDAFQNIIDTAKKTNEAMKIGYQEDVQNFSNAQDAKKEKFIATEKEIRLFKELTKTQQDEIDRLTNETQFADEEQKLQDKIRRLQDYIDNYKLSDEQLRAIISASVEYHNQMEDLKLKKKLDNLNLALSSSSQVYNEIATLHGQLITNRVNQLTKENDEFQRKLKDRKDKGLLTEEEYNKEVAKADLNMRKEIAKNERKAAIMDKTAKALAIIGNVAAGIASAYVPYIPGVSEFRAGVVATMGTIQGATLAATPLPEIPEFAKGGSFITDHPQLFLAGERGREQVQVTPLNQMTTENKNLNLEGANIYITTNNVDDMIEQLQHKAESMGVSMFGR